MKKTIIANWGHAGQGKSDTIKRVAKKIFAHYPRATYSPPVIDYTVDIKVIIEIGVIKIGIESQGDPNSRLLDSLKEFALSDCDMIICSTRTSGKTTNTVSSYHTLYGYNIVWATNYRSMEMSHNDLNDFSANHIFALFQNILAGETN